MNIKLYKPHFHQKKVHDACEDYTKLFCTVVSGRQ